ncbi:MAG: HAMP domain-containing histidine kinase [Planctomyces sp.]|nr:HAMP domain-containing histidine kinase [Planctomyces sp.]
MVAMSPSPAEPNTPAPAAHDAENRRLRDRLVALERMALVGQATAQVAQHLTNQLSVLPLIQLMEREYAADPQLAEFLSLFRESYHQIHETVQQLRRIVRLDSIDGPREPVPLADNIRELASFLRFQKTFPWSQLRLDLRLDSVVLSSRTKLHYILMNLLFNAADAISGRDDGRIVTRLRTEAGFGVIEVEDNGAGIPNAMLPQIWNFEYTTKPGSEHGLGLHMVKCLVEGDGGDIACRMTDENRTLFTVRLPLAPEDGRDRNDDSGAHHRQPANWESLESLYA